MESDFLLALCYELLIDYCEYFTINCGYRNSFADEYDYLYSLKVQDLLAFCRAGYALTSILSCELG